MSVSNQRGFSLMEIIISLGALGIVSLGVMNLMKMQSQTTLGSKGATDLASAIATLDATLKDPALCTNNLKDISVAAGTEISEIKDYDGNTLYKAGQVFGGGVYEVEKMAIGSVDPKTGKVEFNTTLRKVKTATGVDSIIKTISFYPNIDVGTNKVVDCFYGVEKKAQALLEKLCENIYGTTSCDYAMLMVEAKIQFCQSKPWLSWNGSKCELLDHSKTCGTKYISGYDANGGVVCSTYGP